MYLSYKEETFYPKKVYLIYFFYYILAIFHSAIAAACRRHIALGEDNPICHRQHQNYRGYKLVTLLYDYFFGDTVQNLTASIY